MRGLQLYIIYAMSASTLCMRYVQALMLTRISTGRWSTCMENKHYPVSILLLTILECLTTNLQISQVAIFNTPHSHESQCRKSRLREEKVLQHRRPSKFRVEQDAANNRSVDIH